MTSYGIMAYFHCNTVMGNTNISSDCVLHLLQTGWACFNICLALLISQARYIPCVSCIMDGIYLMCCLCPLMFSLDLSFKFEHLPLTASTWCSFHPPMRVQAVIQLPLGGRYSHLGATERVFMCFWTCFLLGKRYVSVSTLTLSCWWLVGIWLFRLPYLLLSSHLPLPYSPLEYCAVSYHLMWLRSEL